MENFDLLLHGALQEVIVSGNRKNNHVKDARMGKWDICMQQVKAVPVLPGEVDLLKTLQLLPGVRNTGEGNTGMYVRGGGPDQNLILLDDAGKASIPVSRDPCGYVAF